MFSEIIKKVLTTYSGAMFYTVQIEKLIHIAVLQKGFSKKNFEISDRKYSWTNWRLPKYVWYIKKKLSNR